MPHKGAGALIKVLATGSYEICPILPVDRSNHLSAVIDLKYLCNKMMGLRHILQE